MANRNQRQQIAKETVTIMDQGFYISMEGERVQIADQMKQCNGNSRVYTEKDFTSLLPPKGESNKLTIVVKDELVNFSSPFQRLDI